MSAICARPSKGKGEIYKRVENRRLSTLLCARAASAHVPAAGRGKSPRSAERNSSLNFSEKLSAR